MIPWATGGMASSMNDSHVARGLRSRHMLDPTKNGALPSHLYFPCRGSQSQPLRHSPAACTDTQGPGSCSATTHLRNSALWGLCPLPGSHLEMSVGEGPLLGVSIPSTAT